MRSGNDLEPHVSFNPPFVKEWLTTRRISQGPRFFRGPHESFEQDSFEAAIVHASVAAMSEPLRRLSDKILAAFNQACDQRESDVAELLLQALDLTLTRQAGNDKNDLRNELGQVAEAYARLKTLRSGG